LKLFHESGEEGKKGAVEELIHCKNPCKCHNVPPSSTTIKKKKVMFVSIGMQEAKDRKMEVCPKERHETLPGNN
jgi:hypothetical protein